MTTTPKNAGSLAKTASNSAPAKKQPTTLKGWLSAYEKDIAKALPQQISPERFTRICATALTGSPQLQRCDAGSFIGAILNSAQLGLEPNTPLGEAYLIPYGNKCQFQLGYKGLIKLARNSGEIVKIGAEAIHQNDEFSYTLGIDPAIEHKPVFGDRGPVIGYYAFYKTKSGEVSFEVATKKEIDSFARARSKTFGKGPWQTDFDAMAKKTLIKRVLKFAPLATETQMAILQDETIKKVDVRANEPELDMSLIPDQTDVIDLNPEDVQEHPEDGTVGEINEGAKA